MKRKNRQMQHLCEYLALATAGVFFIFLLSLFKGDRTAQFTIMLFFAAVYVGWGIVHHHLNRTLYLKIVVEYILIAAIGILLLLILLLL